MKWTNSSNNNNSGERTSVFYTSTQINTLTLQNGINLKNVNSEKLGDKMEINGSAGGEQLKKTADAIKADTLKRKRNLGLLDYEMERRCREEQLATVLRALKTVEAKLRNEQQIIRRQLCEKDAVINRQMCTIRSMKRKLGDVVDDGDDKIGETAQMCPKCRKNYYHVDMKSSWTQTLAVDDDTNGEHSSLQSVEYMSSSEEAESLSSFIGARRSRKYTSKRSFKDYKLKSRESMSSERSFNSEPANQSDKENQMSESNYSTTSNAFSNLMNGLHGIKSSLRSPKSSLVNTINTGTSLNSDGDSSLNSSSSTTTVGVEDTVIYNNTNINGIYVESPGSTRGTNRRSCEISKKYTENLEVKQKIEPTDDWYASASDMEETENGFGKSYGQAGLGNPVLECVNQILLQEPLEEKESKSNTTPTKSPSTPRSKRVHFSTQHTMVQMVPRAPYPIMEQDEHQLNYDVPNSSFTNDYEQVGSSNHYVDMESKQGSEEGNNSDGLRIRKPPALPPKPANLIRLQQVQRSKLLVRAKSSPATVDGSEPDYCSIADVKETVKTVVAEIHKSADGDYSTVRDDQRSDESSELEESFEDVPKLPMVEEIVTPKKKDIQRYIGRDNYITKSTSPYRVQAIRSSLTNRQKIAQILAEITKQPSDGSKSATPPVYSSPINAPIVSPISDLIDGEPHKSAFDWYDKNMMVLPIEVDKEDMAPIIEEKVERPSDPITQDPVFYSGDEAEDLRNITTKPSTIFKNLVALAETPAKKLGPLKGGKNYQFFLEDSGLSSKSILPGKKRVYYTGPFV